MGQGRAQIYNLISILFLVLTVGAIVLIGARMAAPPPAATPVAFSVPTSAVLPTITPSFTPTFTLTPTATLTLTPTITPSISPTVTWTLIPSLTPSLTSTIPPTLTPSLTPIPPTLEPSLTITATLPPTETGVPTVTPVGGGFIPQNTVPPPSPYPFVLRDNQVIYTSNFANTAQCAWQGIGGQVFDVNGQPLANMRVHVFGNGVDLFTTSGTNTLYGLSGWEVPLNTTVTSNSYIVELQTSEGTIVSPQITVTFVPDCTKNLALVNFAQTRAF